MRTHGETKRRPHAQATKPVCCSVRKQSTLESIYRGDPWDETDRTASFMDDIQDGGWLGGKADTDIRWFDDPHATRFVLGELVAYFRDNVPGCHPREQVVTLEPVGNYHGAVFTVAPWAVLSMNVPTFMAGLRVVAPGIEVLHLHDHTTGGVRVALLVSEMTYAAMEDADHRLAGGAPRGTWFSAVGNAVSTYLHGTRLLDRTWGPSRLRQWAGALLKVFLVIAILCVMLVPAYLKHPTARLTYWRALGPLLKDTVVQTAQAAGRAWFGRGVDSSDVELL